MAGFFHTSAVEVGVIGMLASIIAFLFLTRATKIAELRQQDALAMVLRRFRLPVVLIVFSAVADDLLETIGFKESWWNDELLALIRSSAVATSTWALSLGAKQLTSRIAEKRGFDSITSWTLKIISNSIIGLFCLGAGFIVLSIWNVNLTPFMASAGLLTVAVSLFSRYLTGLSVYINRPYSIGDYLVLPSGERGEVVQISLANTHIRTRDDAHVIVPNYIMSETRLINESAHFSHFRVRCSVGVAYDSDLDEVEKVLLGALEGNRFVIAEPAPRVRFRSFGDTAVQVELLAWVNDPKNRGQALDLMIRNVHRACRKAGIEIPSPKMELSIRSDNRESARKSGKIFCDPEGE